MSEDKSNFLNKNVINWYPGHMEKARREMLDRLKQVDMLIELRDARIPNASRNPILVEMAENKPRLIILTKIDMADSKATKQWTEFLSNNENLCISLNLQNDSKASQKITNACLKLMDEKRSKQKAKGINPRAIRAMVAGIPNVGKSTLINRVAKKNTVKVANKAGVTRSLTWIHCNQDLDLLDSPGVLWPRFDNQKTGSLLAAFGSINDDILDKKSVAMDTIHIIQDYYPNLLESIFEADNVNPNGMLKAIAKKRNFVVDDGKLDTKRASESFLTDLRKGKFGSLTLERPDENE